MRQDTVPQESTRQDRPHRRAELRHHAQRSRQLVLALFALVVLLGAPADGFAARDGQDGRDRTGTTAAEKDWPWTPLERPGVPKVERTGWVRNPIDAFVLAKLEERGLTPAPEASARALLRRLYFGLTGLPPAAELVDRFTADDSDANYDEHVEHALADKAYGERWGRIWLDLVRYADTRGGAIDYARPHMWRYRDYVIRAFNQDRPYDRFIREQLAADAIPTYGAEGRLGLGFLGQWVQVERDEGPLVRRDFLTDVVGTTASVFLGMTVGCARCHDHKFDPISIRDYYRMEAFFAPLQVAAEALPFTQYETPLDDPQRWDRTQQAWSHVLTERKKWQDSVLDGYKLRLTEQRLLGAPGDLKDLAAPVAADLKRAMAAGVLFNEDERKTYALINRQNHRFANPNSPDYYQPKAYVAKDSGLSRDVATHVLAGGSYKLRGEQVQPGFLSHIQGNDAPANLKGLVGSRRKLLAHWIAAPENPLTARVLVNRLWQHHFGRGLVATPSDFGKRGSSTVHEDLLDWLAAEFLETGWSIKAVQRLIVNSSVYRQAMRHPVQEEQEVIDPENQCLWVRDAVRLEAEVLRDGILAASGQLNRAMGGPPAFPVADDDLLKGAKTWWEPSPRKERSRRSIYLLQIRSFALPFMKVFDGPSMDESCPVRGVTTVTPQVFALFNSQFVHEQSRFMAERIEKEVGSALQAQIERAFRLALQRSPTPLEGERCVAFLRGNGPALTTNRVSHPAPESARAETNDTSQDASFDAARPQTNTEARTPVERQLSDLCLVLLNTNEFLFLD